MELYYCVLESKSFLEKMTVIEHTVPFFLPIREAENDLLSSNAIVSVLIVVKFEIVFCCTFKYVHNLQGNGSEESLSFFFVAEIH